MLDVLKVARLLGILPFKEGKNGPVLCHKWLYYSYFMGIFIPLTTFYRALLCLKFIQSSESLETRSTVYLFLLKWEPMFYFLTIGIVYYPVRGRKEAERSIKVMKLLFELESGRSGKVGKKLRYVIFGFSIIFSILALVQYCHVTQPSYFNMIDIFFGYTNAIPLSIQLLQLCVYFKCVLCEYHRLEDVVKQISPANDKQTIGIFMAVKTLREIMKKIEHVYYPNIIWQEIETLMYSILMFRGTYDFICHYYTSAILAIIVLVWISIDLPLQFCLMHLSDATDEKVNLLL